MRNPRINYVWVGGFVIAMGVVFVAALAILGGRIGATDRYHSHYDNVTGVVPGTQLLLEGFRVGQVEKVEPSREAGQKRYRVHFSVAEGVEIPEDSVAWITEPGLLAAITVDIHAGASERFLEPGSEIEGRDLQSVFTLMGTLAGEIETIVERDIRPLLDSVAEVSPRVLANLESVTSDLAAATEQVALLFDAENRTQIDGMLDDFSAMAENLDSLTSHLEASLLHIDEMVRSVDGLVSENTDDVERMIEDLGHTLESVARHVDTINANLESTSHNVNEFSRQIRRNPAVLVRGTGAGGSADENGDPP